MGKTLGLILEQVFRYLKLPYLVIWSSIDIRPEGSSPNKHSKWSIIKKGQWR